MLALITAALQGLASIPKIIEFFQKMNLEARLEAIEKRQQSTAAAFTKLAEAKSKEDYANAARDLSNSWSR
jgi:hypothetical protein